VTLMTGWARKSACATKPSARVPGWFDWLDTG
jgi:hypothetical protein